MSFLPCITRRIGLLTVPSIGLLLILFLDGLLYPSFTAAHPTSLIFVQRSGKASSPHVRSAMTVLATLDSAHVLPPEGTKEADRVIQSVIQFQSLFTKSTDPAIQEFLHRAIAGQGEEQTAQMLEQFQSRGWTPDVLQALSHRTLAAQPAEIQALAAGFQSVNLSVEDFTQFMELIRNGEQTLASTGHTFHEVFASQRTMMPGASH